LKGGLPSTLLCVLGVARLSAAWIIKHKSWIFNNLFFIASLGIILWAWGGARGVGYLIAGMLSTTGFSMGVNMVGQKIGYSRVLKSLDLFLAFPRPRNPWSGLALGLGSFASPKPHGALSSPTPQGSHLSFYTKAPRLITAESLPGHFYPI